MGFEEVGQEVNASDAAFLYVLFTFQFFLSLFGIYNFFKKLYGTPEFKKENKVTPIKLCIQIFVVFLVMFWMHHTYDLIKKDKSLQN